MGFLKLLAHFFKLFLLSILPLYSWAAFDVFFLWLIHVVCLPIKKKEISHKETERSEGSCNCHGI